MFYYRKSNAKKSKPRKKNAKNKKSKTSGLNKKEKSQVSKMIKGRRETFFMKTIQYALGQSVSSTYEQHQLSPHSCFQSANKITMIGLTSADTFSSIGNDVNSNAVHTTGQRLFLTAGCRARDLGDIAGASLDGDQGYMKSHLQKIKIHARTLMPGDETGQQDKMIPLNFRVLVFQVNGSKPAGSVPSITNVGSTASPSLFRDRLDFKVGIDDQILPYEFDNGLRVDTSAFKVVRDIKFKLSNPLLYKNTSAGTTMDNATAVTYQYPATKELDLWLPQPKKVVKFDEGTQLPTNYDYRYYTFVFCTSDSTYGSGSQQGTTENRWCMESTSIARCQEY